MNKGLCARLAVSVAGLAVLATLSTSAGGCSRPAPAAATPTKTQRPAQAVAVQPPTDTPTAVPSDTPTPTPTATPTITPTPTVTPRPANINPLTGLPMSDPALAARRPLFVVVNNSAVARPQYGLAEAELVYEYIMEGRSVTRFTAVFLASESERIGPVRSARLVNFYLTPQYGGALAASGAGNDVRWWLKHKMQAPYLDVDLDDPSNTVYSWSLGSYWETRLQTNTARLRQWLAKWKVEQDPKLPGFSFAETAPAGDSGQSAAIAFPDRVAWTYDSGSGRYLRTMSGAAHKDAASGKQLSAANVVLQTVTQEATNYVEDSLGNTSIRIITVGEGPVTLLRDGVAVTGTWKAGDTEMPRFVDSSGNLIPLKPGNSWFELVAAKDQVTVN